MEQPHRQCRTCRYFQPAPLRGKGWCHHPFWYTPQHQRLVNARGIECRRPFGDYWKARVDETAATAPPAPAAPPRELGAVYEFVPGLARMRWSARPLLVVTPLVILLLLVAAIWLPWRPADQAGDVARASKPAATMQAVVTIAPTPVSTPPSIVALAPTTTPSPTTAPPIPTATAVAVVEPTFTPVPPTATAEPAPPTPEPEPEPQIAAEPPPSTPAPVRPTLGVGENAIVTSGDLRLRVRNAPGTTGTIVGRISNGEQLSIVGGPRQADGETWWQVRYSNLSGWVSGAFLQPTR